MVVGAAPREKLELLELDSVIERGRRVRELMSERLARAEPGHAGRERN